jgi:SAM-dependent methyltransferase
MNKEYVQQYVQLEKEHWWFVARKKIIARVIEKYINTHTNLVLNVGAAGGASTEWLARYGEVTSVENDPYFLQHLQANHKNVVEASIHSLPFTENSFDLVCVFDVLEHVDNDRAAMLELQRVCKPSGFIIISVPAYQWLWSSHDVVNDHKRRYNQASLRTLVNDGDTLVWKETSYFNFLLLPPIVLARKIANIFYNEKNPVSDFETFKLNGFLNRILKKIFLAEMFLAKWMRLPWGVSLIGVLLKQLKTTK